MAASGFADRIGSTAPPAQDDTRTGLAPGKRTLSEAITAHGAPAPAPAPGRADTATSPPVPTGPPIQALFGTPRDGATPRGAAELPAAGSGAPMPRAVQAKLERGLGADFSDVRIHQGDRAAAIGARAYTEGTQIHFAPGEYRPEAPDGQALLGHELVHVQQQRAGRVAATGQAKGVAINDDYGLEREADELGARAARGEVVHGAAPAAAGSPRGAVQRAKIGNAPHNPNVTAYPTREGGQAGTDHIPFDPACQQLIVGTLFPALQQLGAGALKQTDKGPSGYMIGVARTRTGAFVATTSGTVPDAALRIISAQVSHYVASNVSSDVANKYVPNVAGRTREPTLDRYQVLRGQEAGGLAGFCAAFKMLYAHPELELVGMAEVVFAPNSHPAPAISNHGDHLIKYEHGDTVPSCLTCQAAFAALQQRGREIRDAIAHGEKENSPAEVLKRRRIALQNFAGTARSIPKDLLDILPNASDQQKKAFGDQLGALGNEIRAPLELVATRIEANAAVRAEDDALKQLMDHVAGHFLSTKTLLSQPINQATKEYATGAEQLKERYQVELRNLRDATGKLVAYVDNMVQEREAPVVKPTLEARLAKHIDRQPLGKWLDLEPPADMQMIKQVTEFNGVLLLDAADNETWQLDPKTSAITLWDG